MRLRNRVVAALAVSATAVTLSTVVPTSLPSAAAGVKAADCAPTAGSTGDARLTKDAYHSGDRESYDNAAYARALRRGEGKAPAASTRTGPVTIPVYAHVIQEDATVGAMTDTEIADQITAMNEGFAGEIGDGGFDTGISFQLVQTDRTQRADWYPIQYGSAKELEMKTALRKGGKRTLNLYFGDLVDEDGGPGLLGWATFPDEYATAPARDGVVILNESVPGGDAAPYNLGATGTHEVGHWLGLFHTFEDYGTGNGCAPGDLVADTAAENEPQFDCVDRDSCPLDAGTDPIHNFMDYTDDACMDELTAGQSARVDEQIKQFRNTAPTLAGAALSTTGQAPVSYTASAVDPEGDAVVVAAGAAPANGTVARSGNTFTYTARGGFTGTDTFGVTATDVFGSATTATVTVNVGSTAPPPAAVSASTTSASAPKKVKKGKKVTVVVSVVAANGTAATGPVSIAEGGATVGTGTVAAGSATVTLSKKLGVGKHTLTVTYGGSPTVAASSTTVKVKVVKKKRKKK